MDSYKEPDKKHPRFPNQAPRLHPPFNLETLCPGLDSNSGDVRIEAPFPTEASGGIGRGGGRGSVEPWAA